MLIQLMPIMPVRGMSLYLALVDQVTFLLLVLRLPLVALRFMEATGIWQEQLMPATCMNLLLMQLTLRMPVRGMSSYLALVGQVPLMPVRGMSLYLALVDQVPIMPVRAMSLYLALVDQVTPPGFR